MMKRVVVVGAGKMGLWLAQILSDSSTVAIYDRKALPDIANDRITKLGDHSGIKAFEPEILINAVTAGKEIEAFSELIHLIPQSCILIDIASVKSGFEEYYKGSGHQFASFHPMFGPTFANMEMLEGKTVISILGSHPETTAFFTGLFSDKGVIFLNMSFGEHDRQMATALSLPIALSLLFLKSGNDFASGGTSFERHRTVAQGIFREDPDLLLTILKSDSTKSIVNKITEDIRVLSSVLNSDNSDDLLNLINEIRRGLPS